MNVGAKNENHITLWRKSGVRKGTQEEGNVMINHEQLEEMIEDFMNCIIFAKDKGISDISAQLFAHAAVIKLSGPAQVMNSLPVCSIPAEGEPAGQSSLAPLLSANGSEGKIYTESKQSPATEKQLAYLKKYGIPFKDGITKHEAYLIISVHMRERNK